MKIIFSKKKEKDFNILNLYLDDKNKKNNIEKIEFLNFKIEKEYNRRQFISLIRKIIQKVKTFEYENISFNYEQFKNIKVFDLNNFERAKILVENVILAEYKYDIYLSKKTKRIKNILIFGSFFEDEKKGFAEGEIIANSMNFARDLANTPGRDMTPTILTNIVKKEFKNKKKLKIKTLSKTDTKKIKMGLFNAVGQGSDEPSKFIIIEYFNGEKSQKPIVLIGKGITYDSGGLNLKPTGGLEDMHMDMTGGAVVLGVLKAIVKLNIKKNVIVLIPAVENAISGSAYRPGDIIKSMSGKSVFIGNTDAEGRLILADAITYAKKYKPSIIIDIATLTGASIGVIGKKASIILSNNNDLIKNIKDLGEKTGDYVWDLPLWDEFSNDMKTDFAEINNISKNKGGGAITAAIFIYEFIKDHQKDIKWLHIDIAPRMDSADHDYLEKGATGEPLRLLLEYIRT